MCTYVDTDVVNENDVLLMSCTCPGYRKSHPALRSCKP